MSASAYDILIKKFGSFTEIQKAAFPEVEKGKNCIIIAPTGSGKTEASFLPLLDKLSREQSLGIKILYVTPLRSLNRDVMRRLEDACRLLGVTIGVRHGDTPVSERAAQSRTPPQVLITTPETLQNLFLSERLREAMKNVGHVIVDEIHELYHNKRGAQLSIALERLEEISPNFQRIGVSATIADHEEAAKFLCGSRDCKIVSGGAKKGFDISISMPSVPKKEHKELANVFKLDEPSLARLEEISDLIKANSATILFTNTRAVAESIGSKLTYMNRVEPFGEIGVHHGSLDKAERIKLEDDFKRGRIKCIVATSSLELGIDVGRVNLVIQYGSPRQVDRLIQRVGRGGHLENKVSTGRVIVANVIDAIESAIIVKLLEEQKLEKFEMEKNALDVLVNQICAIAVSERNASADRIFDIIRRSGPYSSMEKNDFYELLGFAESIKLIKFHDNLVSASSRTRKYFVKNISVLPENTNFIVKNYINNKTVGALDEKFVANYIDEGFTFITRGLPWKVVSIDKGVINVEPSMDFEAAVPDWEGEDIPVSYDVASRMFHYLNRTNIAGLEDVLDRSAKERLHDFIEMQSRYFIPGENKIFVEELEEYTVIYVALGKLANEFLGKIIGSIVSAEIGLQVRVKATPYSVIIDYSNTIRREKISHVLEVLKDSALSTPAIEKVIVESDIFRYKFIGIAKLFGVIEKGAALTRSGANRLIAFYRDSPLFKETLRDVTINYFDAERVEVFLEKLKQKKITAEELGGASASPFAEELFKSTYHYRELVTPVESDTELNSFLEGLLKKDVELICTYCGFVFKRPVNELWESKQVLCPGCKSPMIATNKEGAEEIIRRKRNGAKLKKSEYSAYVELINEASLVEAYGGRAIVALSTYGVGTATAARILKMLRKDYKIFIMDLINAQRTFIKNKRFWAAP